MLGSRSVLERTMAAARSSKLPWHVEDADRAGMGDSIAAGVRASAGVPAWLILRGDLPLIQACTLRRIAQAPMSLDVVVPVFEGRCGHPVRFSARCGPELTRPGRPGGAAGIVRAGRGALWPVDDRGRILDIDTLDHLRRARQLLRGRQMLP